MVRRLNNGDAGRILVRRIQKHVKVSGTTAEGMARNALNTRIVRHGNYQQTVPRGQVTNLDLEVHENLEERSRWILGTVDHASATSVPAC